MLARAAGPPLHPSPDQARAWLRRELVDPDYHRGNPITDLVNWFLRRLDSGTRAAADAPALATFAALVLLVLLVLAVGWVASRARRTARSATTTAAVLTGEAVSAEDLRRRAEAALAEGRCEDAVADAFRALTLRQAERGLLEDAPSATAHEVAVAMGLAHPALGDRVSAAALLFEAVLYGERPATPDQVRTVLDLDLALVAV